MQSADYWADNKPEPRNGRQKGWNVKRRKAMNRIVLQACVRAFYELHEAVYIYTCRSKAIQFVNKHPVFSYNLFITLFAKSTIMLLYFQTYIESTQYTNFFISSLIL